MDMISDIDSDMGFFGYCGPGYEVRHRFEHARLSIIVAQYPVKNKTVKITITSLIDFSTYFRFPIKLMMGSGHEKSEFSTHQAKQIFELH